MNCVQLLLVTFFAAVSTAHYFASYRNQPCAGDVISTAPLVAGECRSSNRPGATFHYTAGLPTTCASYCLSPYAGGQFKCGACFGLGEDSAKFSGITSYGYTKYDCNETAMRPQMCSDAACTNCSAASTTFSLHDDLASCPASPSGLDLYQFPCRYIEFIEYNASGCTGPVSRVSPAYTCDVCSFFSKVVCDEDLPATSSLLTTTGTARTTTTGPQTTTGTPRTTTGTQRTTTETTGTLPTTASPPTTTTMAPPSPATTHAAPTTLPSSVSVVMPSWIALLLLALSLLLSGS